MTTPVDEHFEVFIPGSCCNCSFWWRRCVSASDDNSIGIPPMLFKHRCGLIIEQYQKKHADPKHWKVFAGFSMAASLFADLGGSITPNVETFNTMLLSTKGRNHLSGFVPNFMAECVSCGRCVCDVTQLKRKDACCCQEW